jgi:hypothetical protein
MRVVLSAALAALVAACALTSIAAAGPAATKQRVQIDIETVPGKGFVLSPLEVGALERDSGAQSCKDEVATSEVLRDGQQNYVTGCRAMVLTGKRGTLVLRYQYAWVEAGGSYNIATGTWKVLRGTGKYAGVSGHGRSAEVGSPKPKLRLARFQGYLTAR